MSESAPDESKTVSRSAVLLFSTCLVALVAIWLLNTSLYTARSRYAAARGAVTERQQMLDRLRLFHADNVEFYERLLFALVLPYTDYEDTAEDSAPVAAFRGDAKRLAQLARSRSLTKNALYASHPLLRKSGGRLDEDWTSVLMDPHAETNWGRIALWLVYNTSEIAAPFDRSDDDNVSYLNRSAKGWGASEQMTLLLNRLVFEGEKSADAILSAEYVDAAKRAADLPKSTNQVGLSGLGMAVPVSDALCLVPLIILALAAQFLVVRSRDALTIQNFGSRSTAPQTTRCSSLGVLTFTKSFNVVYGLVFWRFRC